MEFLDYAMFCDVIKSKIFDFITPFITPLNIT